MVDVNRRTIAGPLEGLTFVVDERGPGDGGPPLVWLHSELGDFAGPPLTDELAGRLRTLVAHLPGWGVATGVEHFDQLEHLATAYWWLFDELGLDAVHLAGLGIGATLAAEIAIQQPGRVPSLVLAGPFGLFREDDPGGDLFALVPRDVMPLLYADPAGPVASAHFPPAADAYERGLQTVRRVEVLAPASRFLFPIPDTGIGRRLYRLGDRPVELFWGAKDGIVPPSLAEDWAAHLPGARTTIVEGAAHMAPYEDPAAFSAVLERATSAAVSAG
ncbi:MAG TPA: alpha/beta hydrolase [Acidimicrobiales bacterium]|jgi:pimeloyl-ACP methyl ester carboxylesterase